VDSTWSYEALQQLQRCRLFWVQPVEATVEAVALAPLPELVVVAAAVLEPEVAVVAERLAAVAEAQRPEQAQVVQLSFLQQASRPELTLPPGHHQALRQPH
jgi:hypothetical protein